MKRAIIDLGTNTFNLLVGSIEAGKLVVTFATKEAVMLGMDGINHGRIADDALARAKKTLSDFRDLAVEKGAKSIVGYGTSAMREATNAYDLTDWADEELGISIQIISGDQEAELIYKGVSLLHSFDETGIIMDIGGGSNEFIVANEKGVLEAQSFNIGVSRLYQLAEKPDSFTAEIIDRINRVFEKETQGFFEKKSIPHLIGASGSFETIYEMLHKKRFPSDQKMKELPIAETKQLIEWSMQATLQDRMDNQWIVPMRKKMLPFAAYSIYWVMNKLDTKRVSICPYSLKEGAFVVS